MEKVCLPSFIQLFPKWTNSSQGGLDIKTNISNFCTKYRSPARLHVPWNTKHISVVHEKAFKENVLYVFIKLLPLVWGHLGLQRFHLSKGPRTVRSLSGPPLGARYEFQKHNLIFKYIVLLCFYFLKWPHVLTFVFKRHTHKIGSRGGIRQNGW